jgi:HlyD family secretion protein
MKFANKKFTLMMSGAALVALLLLGYLACSKPDPAVFRTVPVKRGDLLASISATGTVEPEEVIDIGAQVGGRIVTFGKDKQGKAIDYGSVVEPKMVLARIDDALYAADVESAKATLGVSQASLQRSEADLGQLKAKLFQAERDWGRAKKLGPSDALSQADYDAAQSAYETAKANVAVGQAAIAQAKKTVDQSKAALQRAQQNLSYCTIISPVKGVIVDRRVNIGQTVVASLNAPSLFLIAKDLTRIQVWVSVNEADIGLIHPGQPATFTVDAFPGQVFEGTVGKVRLNATMTQNVVTYTVEVTTDNPDGKLLPYLTANVKFVVGESKNVLMVPNAALRWEPKPDQIIKEAGEQPRKAKKAELAVAEKPAAKEKGKQPRGVVWVPEGSLVRPVRVRLGLSDGAQTEVQNPDLKEDTPIVVGEAEKTAKGKEAPGGSPFAPQLFRGAAGSSPKGDKR